jgi:hypothetical protein
MPGSICCSKSVKLKKNEMLTSQPYNVTVRQIDSNTEVIMAASISALVIIISVLLWIDKVNQLFFYTVLNEIYLQNSDT